MTKTGSASDQQAAQLLRILYDYVVDYFPSHPTLLPAVAGLHEAAQHYGSHDSRRAFQKASDVYQFLLRIRTISPDLPMP